MITRSAQPDPREEVIARALDTPEVRELLRFVYPPPTIRLGYCPHRRFVLSCKGILPVLWELNPFHENLLPTFSDGPHYMREYVTKPIVSREGANVTIHTLESDEATEGKYGGYPQEFAKAPHYDGNTPIIGSWMIGGTACGIGIRESDTLITGNTSRWVPHIFTTE
jgi:glutathionylspermidine synthase